jgi:putative spermidine/putrescine transport system permease protein
MAKVASRRAKAALVIAILIPLWSGYLVKVLSWRNMLSTDGFINWVLEPFGLHGPGYGNTAVWLVMSYLWLPYMVLPIFAGLDRIPNTLISAS